MDTEESQKWRAAHKLYANFQLLRGISSLPQPLSCSVVSYNIIFLFQKKILLTCEWVKSLSRVRLFATLWTGAHQAPQSIGFSRQEYWSRLPFPSPGDLPDPGIKPRSPTLQADTLTSEPCWLEDRISSTTYIVCQESNSGILHCRQILYHLSHQSSPKSRKWIW